MSGAQKILLYSYRGMTPDDEESICPAWQMYVDHAVSDLSDASNPARVANPFVVVATKSHPLSQRRCIVV